MMEKESGQQTVYLLEDDLEYKEIFELILKPLDVDFHLYTDPFQFLEEFRYDQVSCLLLDVRLNGMSGLKVQKKLNQNDVRVPIIFISGHGDVRMAVRAMKSGAFDFFTKPFNNQILLDKIQDALEKSRGEFFKEMKKQALITGIHSLTQREREVAKGIIQGKLGKVIAHELNISLNTVDAHRAKVMRKMDIKSSAEFIGKILKNNLEIYLGCSCEVH